MIYKNGQMQLVCLSGEKQNTALFLRLENNELVKGYDIVWGDNENIHWNRGDYRGNIKLHLKDSD